MKKLDTSFITPTASQPIKQGTLDFLQQSYQELANSIVQNIIGAGIYNPAIMYKLYGCVNSGSGLNYFISSGAVFYNGEIYLVPSTTFTAPSGQVAIATLDTQFVTAANADPTIFTDGSSHNVHQNRVIKIIAGTTGSGIVDYTSFVSPNLTLTPGGSVTITGTYPHLTINAPVAPSSPILAKGITFVGDVPSGTGLTQTITFSDLGTNSYIVLGTIESPGGGSLSQDSSIDWAVYGKTNTTFSVHFQENQPAVQQISFAWVIISYP